jgi:hypothetical protein
MKRVIRIYNGGAAIVDLDANNSHSVLINGKDYIEELPITPENLKKYFGDENVQIPQNKGVGDIIK